MGSIPMFSAMKTKEEIQRIVAKGDFDAREELYRELAANAFDYIAKTKAGEGNEDRREEIIDEAVNHAFSVEKKFNPDKGLAFNFFTTGMMCVCRQMMRRHGG